MSNMRRFFQYFSHLPVVFYCEAATHADIASRSWPIANVTFVHEAFTALAITRTFPRSVWAEQLAYDVERYHTAELGIVWANKKEFMRGAAQRTCADWVVWVDVGCIRSDAWEPACAQFTQRNMRTLTPGIYVQCLKPIPADVRHFAYADGTNTFIAGAIIVGHAEYLDLFCAQYNVTAADYLAHRVSITSDQYVMASMVNQKLPWLHTINYYDCDAAFRAACIDEWFFCLAWL
jgi:hypothetical protein